MQARQSAGAPARFPDKAMEIYSHDGLQQ